MKQKILLLFALAFVGFLMTSSSGGRASAANSGNTGAPGETTTCGNCHTGGSFNPSLSIQIFQQGTTTAVTSYTPGSTYDMRVTVTAAAGAPAGYGFQMVALRNSNNTNAGTWSNPSANTQIASVGSRSYVEHGVNGTFSTSNVFTMKWTAPTAGTGAVKFYSAANAVNGTGNTTGDAGTVNSLTINEGVVVVNAGLATNVMLSDIANAGNGSDLQVSFTPPANQNTVGQYRVFIVKQANAASFNLAAAQSSTFFTAITQNGSPNYSQILSTSAKDHTGAALTNGQTYVAFVMSVADGTNANTNVLSTASAAVLMQGVAGTATGIVLSDIGTAGAPDVQVGFTKPSIENTIASYRVMLVETANAGTFNLASAQMVAAANYATVTPNGSATYTKTFGVGATDVSGNTLQNGKSYTAFVLSIADGTNANVNSLSSGSSGLLLQTVAATASNVTVLDTNNVGTGADLLVYFDAATDETSLSEYRIMVVKAANAAGFNLTTANAVAAANYTVVTPTAAANYSTTLAATAKTTDGATITFNEAYKVFILSTPNGTTTGTAALSAPSDEITLNDPTNTVFQADLVNQIWVNNKWVYLNIDGKYLNNRLQLQVFDVNGRAIKQQRINETENQIDLSNAATGVYWLRIYSDNKAWTKKILIF